MIGAPYITQDFAAFNALFIQPTPWCARNCNGCYVKGFEQQQGVTDSNTTLIGDLISEIGNKILVNQVTLAIDKKPDNEIRIVQMSTIVDEFIERIGYDKSSGETEFHATVHTLNDLLEYGTFWWTPGHKLDMISISHINPGDDFTKLRTHVAPLVNWNLTVDPGVNMNKIKEHFVTVANKVDSVYLVLHKPSTGKFFDPEAFEVHQDFIRFIKTLPQAIQDKVHIDGCVHDSYKFISTGYGCSSNVSRFQVWPDGSVTGCAYNQNRITPPAENMHDLHYNLWLASKQYEFNKCKISNHLDPKHPRVTSRQRNYLELIE